VDRSSVALPLPLSDLTFVLAETTLSDSSRESLLALLSIFRCFFSCCRSLRCAALGARADDDAGPANEATSSALEAVRGPSSAARISILLALPSWLVPDVVAVSILCASVLLALRTASLNEVGVDDGRVDCEAGSRKLRADIYGGRQRRRAITRAACRANMMAWWCGSGKTASRDGATTTAAV
jgi:hypothetical protein